VFVHGFSEHVNRYNDFFPRLSAHGIQVFGWDQRGWGRSVTKPSERGLSGPTSRVIADIVAVLQDKLPASAEGDASAPPLFLMGHSMGGGEVLTLAGDSQYEHVMKRVRGVILECPFIGFTPEETPSFLKVFAGRLVGRVLPRRQLVHSIDEGKLSRIPEVVQSVKDDPLCHNTGTLEGLASMLDRTTALDSGAVGAGPYIRSILLAHGADDKVCSYDKARRWMDKQTGVSDRTTKTYEGGYHQLHADLSTDEFVSDLVEWVLTRSAGEKVTEKDDAAPAVAKL
jgi:acylglycerol lipase